MDFYWLVLYAAVIVVFLLPILCYFYYLCTRCCPAREPPQYHKPVPLQPKDGATVKTGGRRIMCENQEEAKMKARIMSNGLTPVLDPPHRTLPFYHYHLANRAKVLIRGRLVNYHYMFPGTPNEQDLQMLKRRRAEFFRMRALLQQQQQQQQQQQSVCPQTVVSLPRESNDSTIVDMTGKQVPLFSDDDSDYELIDEEEESGDDIQFLDL